MHSFSKRTTHHLPLIRKASSRGSPNRLSMNLNIVQNNEFVDHRTGRFWRHRTGRHFNDATLLADPRQRPASKAAIRELNPAGRRRVVILVTKRGAIAWAIWLMKANYGGLDVDIAAVIGKP